MAEVKEIRRGDIEKELSELEGSYGMPTAEFVNAFRNGRLDETPDFRALGASVGRVEPLPTSERLLA
jgi:hypothetical protein